MGLLADKTDYSGLFMWAGVLIAATALLAFGISAAKRRLLSDDAESGSSWSLSDLSAMRDAGEISDGQYDKLKAFVIKEVTDDIPERRGDRERATGPFGDDADADGGGRPSATEV